MSFQNANLPIQINVSNYVRNDKPVPFIDFVVAASDANTSIGITPTDFQYAGGKVRNLKAILYAPICDVDGDCDTSVCDMSGTKKEPGVFYFDLTECYATAPIALYEDDVRFLDNEWTFADNVYQQIAAMMPAVRQSLARDFLIKLVALTGSHPDGSDTKRITLTNPETLGAYPQGLDEIYLDYSDAGLVAPYIIGGRPLRQFVRSLRLGGLNANGERLDLYESENIWYDEGLAARVLNDTVNGEHVFSVDPRVFKFVTFSQNSGMFRTDLQSLADIDLQHNRGNVNFIKGVYLDPVTGLLFDLYIKYECDNWVVQLKLIWDMWVLPEYVCVEAGVNGLMHWRTCPQVIIPCPTGSIPPSAPSPQQFSWTPDLPSGYPYTIDKMTIGNRPSFDLNLQVSNVADLAAAFNEAWGMSIFSVSGGDIVYTGASALSGTINGNEVSFTFA